MVEQKKRKKRTPDQMIADLQAEIERVKARAAAKEAKAAPEGKPFMAAVRAIDKAAEAAVEAGNQKMARALEAARAPLSEHLIEMGVRLQPAKPGRKPGPRKQAVA